MIQGYPAPCSVEPGEELRLHVSTSYERFVADFFVQGTRLRWLSSLEFSSLGFVELGSAAQSWDWPAYTVRIPDSWASGVYLVRLRSFKNLSTAIDELPVSEMLFIVRNRLPLSKILFKVPLASYHAYNAMGGGSLYETPSFSSEPMGRTVTLLRPGGGVGGLVPCSVDVYRSETTRHTYHHWDAPFIGWLLEHGYNLDFCTSLDLHTQPHLLENYSVLLVGAHDEYWSETERDSVERFVAQGGNVAFFGGNTCWWRVHYDEKMTSMVCNKGDLDGIAVDQWWLRQNAGRPEDSLTGVSYRNGGGWWDGLRQALGYTVQESRHWIFAGTQLHDGDCFGHDTWPPLVGYECDGVPIADIDSGGRATLHPDAFSWGTPRSTTILGVGRLNDEWQDLPRREGYSAREGFHAATMIVHQNSGIVFNAATTDWVLVLTRMQCPIVERITHNVLRRLSQNTRP